MKPSAALLFCLFAAGTVTLLKDPLQTRIETKAQAEQQLSQAFVASKTLLAGSIHAVLNDDAVIQSFASGMRHSLNQYLSGFIRTGELDGIGVFTPQCEPLFAATVDREFKTACHAEKLDGGFYQRDQNGIPVLGLSRSIQQNNQSYGVVAEVQLNHRWLASFPMLQQYLQQLDATLQPDLTIKSGDWVIRVLGSSLPRVAAVLNEVILLFLIAATVLFIVTLGQQRRRLKLEQQQLSGLEDWVKQLTEGRPIHATGTTPVAVIKDHVQQLHHMLIQEAKNYQDELHTTKAQLREVEAQLLRTERLEHEYAKLDSLGAQLQLMTPVFTENLHKANSQIEDLHDALRVGLTDAAQKVAVIMTQWKRGIQEISARKFLRTLSERHYEDGSNALSREVATLIHASHDISNLAINLSLICSGITQRFERLRKHAMFWQDLAEKNTSFHAKWLLELIVRAEEMAQMVNQLPKLHFDRKLDPRLPVPHIAIPDQQWSTILFHVIVALAKSVPEHTRELTIQIHSRVRDHWVYLIVQAMTGDRPLKITAAGRQQLDLAQHLITSGHMKMVELKQSQGLAPIALSWRVKEATLAPSELS